MKPRELFGVGVRILAVWFFTQAGVYSYVALIKSLGVGNAKAAAITDVAYVIMYALLGIVLMATARWWAWVAYGEESKGNP